MKQGTFSSGSLLLLSMLANGANPAPGSNAHEFRLLQLDERPVKWGEALLGTGAVVSYAFVDAPQHFADARNCGRLLPVADLATRHSLAVASIREEAATAFRVWEQAANITFVAIEDGGQADILIGAQGYPIGRAWANVEYQPDSSNPVRSIDQALICLNPAMPWKIGFDGDIDVYDIRYTLVHEIGHAIGLDHPGRVGQVMSFHYDEQHNELQPGDLEGVRLLYGDRDPQMAAGESRRVIHGP